jgi:RNA polymerase sigma-70 factor (ECF subfamily)
LGSPDKTPRFVRLFAQHERGLYAFILSLLPNWADADDVLQETSVRLWEEFDKFVEGSDFGAWARTVARFQVLTYRKRVGRQRQHFSDAFVERVAELVATEQPTAGGDAQAHSEALAKCLGRLPQKQRELLFSYYAPGAVVREVAARWGRTAESLKVTVFRIRRALYDCIKREPRLEAR